MTHSCFLRPVIVPCDGVANRTSRGGRLSQLPAGVVEQLPRTGSVSGCTRLCVQLLRAPAINRYSRVLAADTTILTGRGAAHASVGPVQAAVSLAERPPTALARLRCWRRVGVEDVQAYQSGTAPQSDHYSHGALERETDQGAHSGVSVAPPRVRAGPWTDALCVFFLCDRTTVQGLRKTGGRNNKGHITARHRGASVCASSVRLANQRVAHVRLPCCS
jgi:hypothetical protein